MLLQVYCGRWSLLFSLRDETELVCQFDLLGLLMGYNVKNSHR